jgi:Rieske Fe-S protein
MRRRRVLRWLGLAAASAGATGAAASMGCDARREGPVRSAGGAVGTTAATMDADGTGAAVPGTIPLAPPVRVPVGALADGARHHVTYGAVPVEVRAAGDRITARVLLCTHMGCVVRWTDELGAYRCVCHDGRFDAEGRPIQGFPSRPLARLSARRDGREVVVGESTLAEPGA